MAYTPKKPEQKTLTKAEQEQLDRDMNELAVLIYDIYQDKKRKEQSNELSQGIREVSEGV